MAGTSTGLFGFVLISSKFLVQDQTMPAARNNPRIILDDFIKYFIL
jgi:hypothetical protein